MEGVRYGFYLRPSAALCRAQAEVHDLLRRQYGTTGGGVFMPHCTVKGFFRSDAPVEELIARLDPVMAGRAPFAVFNAGPVPFGKAGIALSIQQMPDGRRNEALQAVHEAAWDAIEPVIHPACNFSPTEGKRDNFHAHLTLAMADIPAVVFDEIVDFVNDLRPIGPDVFSAEAFHLFEFRSDDWTGTWWDTLRWRLLHGWRLGK